MLTSLFQKIREWWQKMISKSELKKAFNVDTEMSSAMMEALQRWSKMYTNDAEWLDGNTVVSMELPSGIAGEIARSATIEMQVEVTAPEGGSNKRAEFLNEAMQEVVAELREQLEYGCAKGGLMLKPWVNGKELAVDYVQADQFYPVEFSGREITACVFSDHRKIGDTYYTRLELHQFQGGNYIVKNAAFRSSAKEDLGTEVSLKTVPAWADLEPEATLQNVDKPLFAYFRYPQANNIDPSSPLGVSCYARAERQIRNADEIYSGLIWEFESGQRAIYADVEAFDKNADGLPILPKGHKRLYRTLDSGGVRNIGDSGKLFEAWSPDFRDASIKSGLDAVLKRVEYNCGLAYGTLSDPETVDKTATEILSSKQRSAATILDTQKALESALDQLMYAMDIWATLGKLATKGKWEATFEFDDSLVTDKQQQWTQDVQAVGLTAMSKVEFRMRNYGESEEVAKQKVADAQAEMPETDLFAEGA